jgi:hypothetical protein
MKSSGRRQSVAASKRQSFVSLYADAPLSISDLSATDEEYLQENDEATSKVFKGTGAKLTPLSFWESQIMPDLDFKLANHTRDIQTHRIALPCESTFYFEITLGSSQIYNSFIQIGISNYYQLNDHRDRYYDNKSAIDIINNRTMCLGVGRSIDSYAFDSIEAMNLTADGKSLSSVSKMFGNANSNNNDDDNDGDNYDNDGDNNENDNENKEENKKTTSTSKAPGVQKFGLGERYLIQDSYSPEMASPLIAHTKALTLKKGSVVGVFVDMDDGFLYIYHNGLCTGHYLALDVIPNEETGAYGSQGGYCATISSLPGQEFSINIGQKSFYEFKKNENDHDHTDIIMNEKEKVKKEGVRSDFEDDELTGTSAGFGAYGLIHNCHQLESTGYPPYIQHWDSTEQIWKDLNKADNPWMFAGGHLVPHALVLSGRTNFKPGSGLRLSHHYHNHNQRRASAMIIGNTSTGGNATTSPTATASTSGGSGSGKPTRRLSTALHLPGDVVTIQKYDTEPESFVKEGANENDDNSSDSDDNADEAANVVANSIEVERPSSASLSNLTFDLSSPKNIVAKRRPSGYLNNPASSPRSPAVANESKGLGTTTTATTTGARRSSISMPRRKSTIVSSSLHAPTLSNPLELQEFNPILASAEKLTKEEEESERKMRLWEAQQAADKQDRIEERQRELAIERDLIEKEQLSIRLKEERENIGTKLEEEMLLRKKLEIESEVISKRMLNEKELIEKQLNDERLRAIELEKQRDKLDSTLHDQFEKEQVEIKIKNDEILRLSLEKQKNQLSKKILIEKNEMESKLLIQENNVELLMSEKRNIEKRLEEERKLIASVLKEEEELRFNMQIEYEKKLKLEEKSREFLREQLESAYDACLQDEINNREKIEYESNVKLIQMQNELEETRRQFAEHLAIGSIDIIKQTEEKSNIAITSAMKELEKEKLARLNSDAEKEIAWNNLLATQEDITLRLAIENDARLKAEEKLNIAHNERIKIKKLLIEETKAKIKAEDEYKIAKLAVLNSEKIQSKALIDKEAAILAHQEALERVEKCKLDQKEALEGQISAKEDGDEYEEEQMTLKLYSAMEEKDLALNALHAASLVEMKAIADADIALRENENAVYQQALANEIASRARDEELRIIAENQLAIETEASAASKAAHIKEEELRLKVEKQLAEEAKAREIYENAHTLEESRRLEAEKQLNEATNKVKEIFEAHQIAALKAEKMENELISYRNAVNISTKNSEDIINKLNYESNLRLELENKLLLGREELAYEASEKERIEKERLLLKSKLDTNEETKLKTLELYSAAEDRRIEAENEILLIKKAHEDIEMKLKKSDDVISKASVTQQNTEKQLAKEKEARLALEMEVEQLRKIHYAKSLQPGPPARNPTPPGPPGPPGPPTRKPTAIGPPKAPPPKHVVEVVDIDVSTVGPEPTPAPLAQRRISVANPKKFVPPGHVAAPSPATKAITPPAPVVKKTEITSDLSSDESSDSDSESIDSDTTDSDEKILDQIALGKKPVPKKTAADKKVSSTKVEKEKNQQQQQLKADEDKKTTTEKAEEEKYKASVPVYEEKRYADDGWAYTKEGFIEHFGGLDEWNVAEIALKEESEENNVDEKAEEENHKASVLLDEEKRYADDGWAYTKEGFIDHFGGLDEWNVAEIALPEAS